MVEEDTAASKEVVAFAVIHRGPVTEHLGTAVRTARPEGRGLGLRHRLHLAIHLAARSLVETGLHAGLPDRFQNADRPHSGHIGGVFGNIKTDPHMTLRPEVVDLVGLQLIEELGQIDRIREVAVVEEKPHPINVRILVKVIDAGRVEGAGPADNPVHLIALGDQQVGQVGTVLTGDSCDECFFMSAPDRRTE